MIFEACVAVGLASDFNPALSHSLIYGSTCVIHHLYEINIRFRHVLCASRSSPMTCFECHYITFPILTLLNFFIIPYVFRRWQCALGFGSAFSTLSACTSSHAPRQLPHRHYWRHLPPSNILWRRWRLPRGRYGSRKIHLVDEDVHTCGGLWKGNWGSQVTTVTLQDTAVIGEVKQLWRCAGWE